MIKLHPNKKLSTNDLYDLTDKCKTVFIRNFNELANRKEVELVNTPEFSFFCESKYLVDVYYDENYVKRIPKFYENDIDSYIGFKKIDGKYYSIRHPNVVITTDTKNILLKENVYPGYNGRYFENNDDLLYSIFDHKYFREENSVVAKDTQRKEYRGTCYNRGSNFYKVRDLAYPKDEWGHAPYINFVAFPKNIKERRIGIEYEFGKSFDLFKPFVKSEYPLIWQSVRDGSLDGIPQGIEFVSIPLKVEQINEISNFIEFCKLHSAKIYDQCGFHVHIGASDYNFMDVSAIVSLCQVIEKDMFKLGGEYRKQNKYCKTLDSKFTGFQKVVTPKDKHEVGKQLYSKQNAMFTERHKQSKYVDGERNNFEGARYYWFNIDRLYYKRDEPEQKTVEFRNHIATFDSLAFENFALLCYYIVEYAKKHSKKTCMNSNLYDVVDSSHIKHRKQLKQYLNSKLK